MHAHHKNLLRDFWLISPGKTPTGKTREREERFLLFFSKIRWTEMQEKYNLSSPRIYPKVWTLNSAKRTQPYTSISEPNNLQTVPVNRTSNKCTLLSRFLCCINVVRTALNEAVPPRNQCQINAGRTTKTVLKI